MRGGALTPTPSVDLFVLKIRVQDLFSGLGCPVLDGDILRSGECGEVLIGRICPRCQKQFLICRHCDRGHVYCGYLCSTLARAEKCRAYQKHYRENSEGYREDHRADQRDRRRQKNVGDQSSMFSTRSARVSTPVRLSAWFAAMTTFGGEDTDDEESCCSICGRQGVFVRFTDFGGDDGRRGPGYRLRL